MKLCRNILVIDDETRWLRTIAMVLNRHIPEAQTYTCENSRQALQLMRELDITLVLLDLNMPYLDGRELLRDIREQLPYVRIIVVTGLNETDIAVACMKQGAYDFIAKTSPTDQLLMCVRRAMEVITLERSYHRIKDGFFHRRQLSSFDQLLTTDVKMLDCFNYAATLTDSNKPILIVGEPGTGKRLFCDALQQLFCEDAPLLQLSLAERSSAELEVALFGDNETPGILQTAANGIVLLSELDHATTAVQMLLARLCQTGRYFPRGSLREHTLNCRLVFTSELTLEQLTEQNFSLALSYVLRPQRITLPPLRERQADIGLLLQHFTECACNTLGKNYLTIPDDLANHLRQYTFPGNISELKATVNHAVSISNEQQLATAPFMQMLAHTCVAEIPQKITFPTPLPTISAATQQLIHEALVRTNNNQTAAAKLLGITQSSLSRRLSKSHE
ncbi:sigma-54-dependent transcriptional regulator [Shewanella sp.]|uniref:sigma-54-dependent transcriptional regulator n=1 Tax=Shewanella sp. TaxID=50422 RepID=UPI003A971F87